MSRFEKWLRGRGREYLPPEGYHPVYGAVLSGFERDAISLYREEDKRKIRGNSQLILLPSPDKGNYVRDGFVVSDIAALRWQDSLVIAAYGNTTLDKSRTLLIGGMTGHSHTDERRLRNPENFGLMLSDLPELGRLGTPLRHDQAAFRMEYNRPGSYLNITIGRGSPDGVKYFIRGVPPNLAQLDHAGLRGILLDYISPPTETD